MTDEEVIVAAVASMRETARENQARVLAGKGSPKILVGGINIDDCPNFHTRELIDLGASIVSVTVEPLHAMRPDRLYCPPDVPLNEALRDLPPGWKPDFYWDAQVEQGHYLPVGTGELEIPTIVSFNHAHLGQALLHMQGMFDCVIAPSPEMAHWGDCVLPWGASWGSMERRIQLFGVTHRGGMKYIDVSCTLGASALGDEAVRHKVLAEIKAIKERRADWNVKILQGAPQQEYFDTLRRSKVSISVSSWGAPMTYRPLEIIEQGAVLVNVDETSYGMCSPLSGVFDKSLFVEATPETLEASIGEALNLTGMAEQFRDAVRSEYSYSKQYSAMFEVASKTTKRKERYDLRDWSRRAFAINHLTNYPTLAAPHQWALTPADRASMYEYRDADWDVCLWHPRDKESFVRWQTDLSRREEPHRETYRRYT